MSDTKQHDDRKAARAARLQAEAAYDVQLRALNEPAAWDGLALADQTGEQLDGNLAYVQQQLSDYQANYGGDHSGNADSFQEARLRARIADIRAEMTRRG